MNMLTWKEKMEQMANEKSAQPKKKSQCYLWAKETLKEAEELVLDLGMAHTDSNVIEVAKLMCKYEGTL